MLDPRLQHVGEQLDGLLQLIILRASAELHRRRAKELRTGR